MNAIEKQTTFGSTTENQMETQHKYKCTHLRAKQSEERIRKTLFVCRFKIIIYIRKYIFIFALCLCFVSVGRHVCLCA